ncbi:MAG: MarR family winged helix-turn-helix transcriptional regulator [Methanoregula sp.]|nr:MarR family winged helix-turn-helix transcriptional regulator [Methanoregula sp.]
MTAREEHLVEVFTHLFTLKNQCSCGIFSECGLSDMTVKQIKYLQVIDKNGDVTFSRLAEITRTSKPTVTEMVNRFSRMDCVYRRPCPDDGRIQYICLTKKGQMIARAEQEALERVIERMMGMLDEHEIDVLIDILRKVR